MPTTRSCFGCAEERPATLIATLRDGRQLSLCARCGDVPGALATFVGAIQCYQQAAARGAALTPWPVGPGAGLAGVDPRDALAATHRPLVLH